MRWEKNRTNPRLSLTIPSFVRSCLWFLASSHIILIHRSKVCYLLFLLCKQKNTIRNDSNQNSISQKLHRNSLVFIIVILITESQDLNKHEDHKRIVFTVDGNAVLGCLLHYVGFYVRSCQSTECLVRFTYM
jgi:hypothetical protein